MVWSKMNQGGNYSCIATNEVGTDTKTFYVLLTGEITVKVCRDTQSSDPTFVDFFKNQIEEKLETLKLREIKRNSYF